MALSAFLIKVLSIVLSSIPLYFALHLVKSGKKPGLMKVALVNVLAGVVASSIDSYFGLLAGILSFFALLFVYKEMFELGWLSAFLVWLLQFVILAATVVVLAFLAGVTLVF